MRARALLFLFLFCEAALAQELPKTTAESSNYRSTSLYAEQIGGRGYAMILKYQLYPCTHVELARRVEKELGLPGDAPKTLAEGT